MNLVFVQVDHPRRIRVTVDVYFRVDVVANYGMLNARLVDVFGGDLRFSLFITSGIEVEHTTLLMFYGRMLGGPIPMFLFGIC